MTGGNSHPLTVPCTSLTTGIASRHCLPLGLCKRTVKESIDLQVWCQPATSKWAHWGAARSQGTSHTYYTTFRPCWFPWQSCNCSLGSLWLWPWGTKRRELHWNHLYWANQCSERCGVIGLNWSAPEELWHFLPQPPAISDQVIGIPVMASPW